MLLFSFLSLAVVSAALGIACGVALCHAGTWYRVLHYMRLGQPEFGTYED